MVPRSPRHSDVARPQQLPVPAGCRVSEQPHPKSFPLAACSAEAGGCRAARVSLLRLASPAACLSFPIQTHCSWANATLRTWCAAASPPAAPRVGLLRVSPPSSAGFVLSFSLPSSVPAAAGSGCAFWGLDAPGVEPCGGELPQNETKQGKKKANVTAFGVTPCSAVPFPFPGCLQREIRGAPAARGGLGSSVWGWALPPQRDKGPGDERPGDERPGDKRPRPHELGTLSSGRAAAWGECLQC